MRFGASLAQRSSGVRIGQHTESHDALGIGDGQHHTGIRLFGFAFQALALGVKGTVVGMGAELPVEAELPDLIRSAEGADPQFTERGGNKNFMLCVSVHGRAVRNPPSPCEDVWS